MKRKRNNNNNPIKVVRLLCIVSVTLVVVYFVMFLRLHHGTNKQKQQQKRTKVQLPNIVMTESQKSSNLQQQQIKDVTVVQQNNESPTTYDEWAIPSTNYNIDPNDLWERNDNVVTKVPLWMKQYFRWHKENRYKYSTNKSLTTRVGVIDKDDDWHTVLPFNILHVTCLSKYTMKCGGIADRLLSLPFIVLIAAQSKRYIIIEWDKPSSLENFLVPPTGGIDWRIPSLQNTNITSNFTKYLRTNGYRVGTESDIVKSSMDRQLPVVQMKFQSHDHGSNYYNSYVQLHDHLEPNFDEIFGIVWNYFFVPVPRIQEKLQQILYNNQLYPGQYRGVHLRALYTQQVPTNEMITKWTINSINCAYYMEPTLLINGTTIVSIPTNRDMNERPSQQLIYFASDSLYATDQAIRYGNSSATATNTTTLVRIVVANASTTTSDSTIFNPLHLDKAKHWKSRTVDEYDPLFIDLYMLGMSYCITYGMGGYGKLASLLRIQRSVRSGVANQKDVILSSNFICSMIHMTAMSLTDCPWIPTASRETDSISTNNNDSSFNGASLTSPIQQTLLKSKRDISNLFKEIFPEPMP